MRDFKLGHAKDNIIEGCLCLEGGAFRGLYTSGVLDCFMKYDINMQTTIGVSAGGLNGLSYVSGDIGRAASLSIGHRHDKNYISLINIAKKGSIVNFDYAFNEYDKEVPENKERLFKGDRRLVVVATNIKTGKAEYFENNDKENIYKAVAASASMPLLSKAVEINGEYYLDGGCVTKLPIRWALNQGFKKIVFIATRDASYRRDPISREFELEKVRYSRYPEFVDSLKKTNTLYNNDCDLIDEFVKEGRIFRIAPSEEVNVSRLEDNIEALEDLYELGYSDGLKILPELRDYLRAK